MPRRTSKVPNCARSEAMRMSHQLDAVPDAPAVDRGDDGLGDARQRSPGDPAQAVLETFASDHRPDGLPLGRMSLQIGTGGERVAGSGNHGDAQRWVVTKVAPDVTQQLVGFDVDGVLDLWAVERDVGDLTALVVEHLCRHGRTFLTCLI
jgi:hypothetical protein